MITKEKIKEGSKFKTESGITWIIDSMEKPFNHTIVRTSMENGSKGNYRDIIEDVVDFLNEQKAVQL